MKALFIEEQAVRYIAQAITFQSGEFDDAALLVDFIRDNKNKNIKSICCKESKNWGYIFHKDKTNIYSYVLLDFETLNGFIEKDDNFIITVLQKIFKFALKRWENYPLNVSEKIINDNHAILFPFPYTNLKPFKILINLSPDKQYTEKRNIKCICAVNMGTGQFETCKGASVINIKNIKAEAERICIPTKQEQGESIEIEPLQVTKLNDINNNIEGVIEFDGWLPLLSKKQRDFINRPLKGNERLEGAAGTGKTISLLLRSINLIKEAKSTDTALKILFICHSISAKDKLSVLMSATSPFPDIMEKEYSKQNIEITTLQEWCTTYLGNHIGQTELLDADAQECKDLQFKLIRDAFIEAEDKDLPTYKYLCSEEFVNYVTGSNKAHIIEALVSEISITIKGRAAGDIDKYKQLPRLEGSIPVSKEGDYDFIYLIYEKYQSMLEQLGYFDNDDISLTSSLQLASPIWRRKRTEYGYDVVIIDEVHLFSYNELSIFHYLCRNEKEQHILYAIDKTQAVGDHGLTKENLTKSMKAENGIETHLSTVFRSSPQIIDLAFSVLTTGAEMFLNFDNPLEKINFSFTTEEEQKSRTPIYILSSTDNEMIKESFREIDYLVDAMHTRRDKILLVSTNHEIHYSLEKYAKERNKPIEVLKRRGDYASLKAANKSNKYVLGYIDYIGGLEFDAVVIVGVDKGRVPQYSNDERIIYQNYEWHNRMYVAITRAKYAVTILGNKSRTHSPILSSAISNRRIEVIEKNKR